MTYDELKKEAEDQAHKLGLIGGAFAAAVVLYMSGWLKGNRAGLTEAKEIFSKPARVS